MSKQQTEPAIQCRCITLRYVNKIDFDTARDKRHHPACPLHETEKHPRLFYFEESEDCWVPAPVNVENIVSLKNLENYVGPHDMIEITFKRHDMTDAEFYGLPED